MNLFWIWPLPWWCNTSQTRRDNTLPAIGNQVAHPAGTLSVVQLRPFVRRCPRGAAPHIRAKRRAAPRPPSQTRCASSARAPAPTPPAERLDPLFFYPMPQHPIHSAVLFPMMSLFCWQLTLWLLEQNFHSNHFFLQIVPSNPPHWGWITLLKSLFILLWTPFKFFLKKTLNLMEGEYLAVGVVPMGDLIAQRPKAPNVDAFIIPRAWDEYILALDSVYMRHLWNIQLVYIAIIFHELYSNETIFPSQTNSREEKTRMRLWQKEIEHSVSHALILNGGAY